MSAFRKQMAELGHPQIGPQSYWKLTHAELRIYAEGMYVEAEKQREARESDSNQYNRDSKRERDLDALEKMDQKVKQQRGFD